MAGEQKIPVVLEDGVSGPAVEAAKALAGLKKSLESDQEALANLKAEMRQLQKGTSVNVESFNQLKAAIEAKKAAIAADKTAIQQHNAAVRTAAKAEVVAAKEAEQAVVAKQKLLKREADEAKRAADVQAKLAEKNAVAAKKAAEAQAKLAEKNAAAAEAEKEGGNSIEDLTRSIKGGAGPLGGMLERFGGLYKSIQKIGFAKAGAVAAIAAIVLIVVKLTKALIEAAIALTQFALASANAARDQRILADAAAGSARGGKQLLNVVDEVAAAVPLARDELAQMAEDLAQTGLKGQALKQALLEAAAVKATGIKDVKQAIDAASRQTLSWGVQIQRLKESFARLFEGLKIEALLKAMKSLLDLFDQSTASGRALKALAETMLQPIIDAMTFIAPYAKALFKGILIAVLQVTVVVLKIKNALRDAFGSLGITSAVKWTTIIRYLGQAFVYVVVVLGLLAAAFVFVIGVVSGFVGVLFTIVAAIGTVLFSIGSFIDGFVNGGKNLVLGLAEGIKSGASAVIQAALGVAGGAVDAIKGALGIHSPSSVAKALMLNFGAGAEQGLDASADKVQSGMADVVAPPAKGGPAKGAGGRGSVTITINGVKGAEQLKDESFWARVAEVLEGAGAEAAITLEGV